MWEIRQTFSHHNSPSNVSCRTWVKLLDIYTNCSVDPLAGVLVLYNTKEVGFPKKGQRNRRGENRDPLITRRKRRQAHYLKYVYLSVSNRRKHRPKKASRIPEPLSKDNTHIYLFQKEWHFITRSQSDTVLTRKWVDNYLENMGLNRGYLFHNVC